MKPKITPSYLDFHKLFSSKRLLHLERYLIRIHVWCLRKIVWSRHATYESLNLSTRFGLLSISLQYMIDRFRKICKKFFAYRVWIKSLDLFLRYSLPVAFSVHPTQHSVLQFSLKHGSINYKIIRYCA